MLPPLPLLTLVFALVNFELAGDQPVEPLGMEEP